MTKLGQSGCPQDHSPFHTCLFLFFFKFPPLCTLLGNILPFLWDALFFRESSCFIPPPPLVGLVFPEKTKKGHYNSRVGLKSQPKSSLGAALSQHRSRAGRELCAFYCTFFFLLSWAKMDLFLFCEGLHQDSPSFRLCFHSCCSSEHSGNKQL